MEDKKIIELYVDRDESAIKETDDKYGKYCTVISNNIVCNISDAEECVNDAYLKTWNSIPPTIPEKLKIYIGRIVRNLSINRYKERHRIKRGSGEIELAIEELEECLPAEVTVDIQMENKRLMEVINGYLDSLSPENRKIFVRRYWYTESIQSIAKMYSMGESMVKTRLFRMRADLKEVLIKEDIHI